MRWPTWIALLAACVALAGCGASTTLIVRTTSTSSAPASSSAGIGFPVLATKNTTRVSGVDPINDAAGVALAVFPSVAPGTHPTAVTIAPTDDWQAAIASSVLMASPIGAPVLLSGSGVAAAGHHQCAQPACAHGHELAGRRSGDPGRGRARSKGSESHNDHRRRALRAGGGDQSLSRTRPPASPAPMS